MNGLRMAGDVLAKLRARGEPYPESAYLFVLASIEQLQGKLPERRHVTGPEVTLACREFALERYGLMARSVLEHWGICGTADFGRIVYALVEVGVLITQPGDREEDFRGVYGFEELDRDYIWGRAVGSD